MSATLLWDGDCGFCRKAVQRWLGETPRGVDVSPWQDRPDLVERFGLEALVLDSVVLIEDSAVSARSRAVVKVLWRQGGLKRAKAALLWIVPRPLRDWGYDWVARNRHRLA